MFGRLDTKRALAIHAEYVKKGSPQPFPKFLEVDRATAKYDDLWHMPLDSRTQFSRTLDIPSIVNKEKADWRLTKIGVVPQQKHKFWLSNLGLQAADYFPLRGDMVVYGGYRHMIINVSLEPNAFWLQTNVWLGLVVECCIPADGDAKPLADLSNLVPSEVSKQRILPEG